MLKWKSPHLTIEGSDPNNMIAKLEFDIRDDVAINELAKSRHVEVSIPIGAGDWPIEKAALRTKLLAAIEAEYPGATKE